MRKNSGGAERLKSSENKSWSGWFIFVNDIFFKKVKIPIYERGLIFGALPQLM